MKHQTSIEAEMFHENVVRTVCPHGSGRLVQKYCRLETSQTVLRSLKKWIWSQKSTMGEVNRQPLRYYDWHVCVHQSLVDRPAIADLFGVKLQMTRQRERKKAKTWENLER
jgi:hypothetical protein